ncbi:PepSY domain-containing protein [Nonomuraea sp. NBC_01738]|uniref:PepSY domain-containing protein n=1 Tax=Nonomuraea sp. NBC_01738 TaxID=2976003 RepID=UPI002E100472|nr:PepSY domain-containing protein [Nonomuraea sp. NBC_01738]
MRITTKVITVTAAALLLAGGGAAAALASGTAAAPKLDAKQAIDAAQKQAPGAWVRELDYDAARNGRPAVWEVELVNGSTEFEVRLDAASGKVLKTEKDTRDSDDDD